MREDRRTFTVHIRVGCLVIQAGVFKCKTFPVPPKVSTAQEEIGIKPTTPTAPKQAAYSNGTRVEERSPLNMARKHVITDVGARMVAAGFEKLSIS